MLLFLNIFFVLSDACLFFLSLNPDRNFPGNQLFLMSVSIKDDQPAIICDVQYTGGNSRYLIFRVDFVATLINRNGFTDHQTFFLICRQEGCVVKIFDISQSLCDGFCGQGGFGISPFRSSGGSEQLCRKIFYRRIDTDPKDEVFDLSCFKVRGG